MRVRLLLLLWLLPTALQALGGPLPIDSELAAQRGLVLELHNASVQLVVDADARPWIRAVPQKADQVGAAALSFDWEAGPLPGDSPLKVARSDGLDGATRIIVEVSVRPSQHVVIQGIDIDLTVGAGSLDDLGAEAGGEGDDEAAAPEGATPPTSDVPRTRTPSPIVAEQPAYRIEIGLDGGQVDLQGLRDVLITAASAVVRTQETAGALRLVLQEGSEGEILAHQGPAEIDASASDVAMVDSQANTIVDLDGGNAIFQDSRGRLSVNSVGSLMVLDNWRGHSTLVARDGPIEIRGGEGNANLEVKGAGLDVTLDGWQGRVKFEQNGGSLTANGWRGQAEVRVANGTELDLNDLRGPMTLVMKADSRGRLDGLEGQLKAEIARSDLDFRNITTVHLKAQRSTLVGSALRRVSLFEVATSRVDLDLTETLGRPTIKLRREARADVRMTAPCYVALDDNSNDSLASQVTVNGCDLLIGRQKAGRRGQITGRYHFLNASIAPDAELEVEGSP